MTMQTAVDRLRRAGNEPSPNRYWTTTAHPRAQLLVDDACAVIDDELQLLAAGRGLVGVDVSEITAVLPSRKAIDDLGQWWQRRLRRAATLRALPDLLSRRPADVELTISHHEMFLLNQAPWSHGDRLLSAFELAYAEIRRHGRERAIRLGARSAPPRPALHRAS